jgi:hypothetical protein
MTRAGTAEEKEETDDKEDEGEDKGEDDGEDETPAGGATPDGLSLWLALGGVAAGVSRQLRSSAASSAIVV